MEFEDPIHRRNVLVSFLTGIRKASLMVREERRGARVVVVLADRTGRPKVDLLLPPSSRSSEIDTLRQRRTESVTPNRRPENLRQSDVGRESIVGTRHFESAGKRYVVSARPEYLNIEVEAIGVVKVESGSVPVRCPNLAKEEHETAIREYVDTTNTVSKKETKADSAIPRQTRPATKAPVPPSSKVPTTFPPKPAPSAVLAKLAKNKRLSLNDGEVEPSHSVAFTDKSAEMKPAAGPHHDERLALIEYFALGLYDHKPSFDDPIVGCTAFVCTLASFHMSAYKITWTFLHRPVSTVLMCATIGNENLPTILRGNGEDAEGSATYVVSGHIVTGSGPSSLEVSESISNEGQAKLSAKDANKALKTVLDRDKEVMKAVFATREFSQKEEKEGKEDGRKRQRREPQD
ncbi:hypothetical protein EDD85DRAFT_783264 [Armillaria nabsnona]|nr:hypothetical protein EDD85DRAFT_783264 [Armillaria nabsnona]